MYTHKCSCGEPHGAYGYKPSGGSFTPITEPVGGKVLGFIHGGGCRDELIDLNDLNPLHTDNNWGTLWIIPPEIILDLGGESCLLVENT